MTADNTCWWSSDLVPDPVLEDFCAIGSGDQAAMAAMYLGCGAEDAVGIAIRVDVNTGGDVETMELCP